MNKHIFKITATSSNQPNNMTFFIRSSVPNAVQAISDLEVTPDYAHYEFPNKGSVKISEALYVGKLSN